MATIAAGTLTEDGVSAPFTVAGAFNLTRWATGTVAAESVVLERSFDGGDSWHPVFAAADLTGRRTTFLDTGTHSLFEREVGMLYRVRASEMAEGQTIGWRAGQ